jgi:CHAD domain-containing protein
MELVYDKYKNSADDFRIFMLEIINQKYDIYRHNLVIYSKEISSDNIHNFRVSSRRFRTALNLYKEIFPSEYFEIIIKIVKQNFKSLGDLRDIYIMINNCKEIKIQYSVICYFIDFLLRKEKKAIAEISKSLSNINLNQLDNSIFFLINDLKYAFPDIKPDFSILENHLNDQLYLMGQLYSQIDYSDLRSIHTFRIATKKFRYSIEILQDFIPNYKDLYKRLVNIQDDAGAIQDNVVLINHLNKYFKKQHNQALYYQEQIESIVNFFKTRQKDLIICFQNDDKIIRSIIGNT